MVGTPVSNQPATVGSEQSNSNHSAIPTLTEQIALITARFSSLGNVLNQFLLRNSHAFQDDAMKTHCTGFMMQFMSTVFEFDSFSQIVL